MEKLTSVKHIQLRITEFNKTKYHLYDNISGYIMGIIIWYEKNVML